MAKERPAQSKIDIILSSDVIKKSLLKRFKELSLSHTDVVRDAREKGLRLTDSHLSVYFNNSPPVLGYPTQKHILWLCLRYDISIGLKIASPKGFNEEKAIENLKRYFPYDLE